MMNCIIIDDEKHSIETISDYISEFSALYLVRFYTDSLLALSDIKLNDNIDIIFMDIDMPRLSGLELAREVRNKTRFLVFISAHPKYALDAFDVQADQYLLKPISQKKFIISINKLLDIDNKVLVKDNEKKTDDSFFIKSEQNGKLIKLSQDNIICIEGMKNYVMIYSMGEKHIAYFTLKEVESSFCSSDDFIRVHRSHIISKKHIQNVEGNLIRLKNGLTIPIGSTYKNDFFNYLNKRTLKSARS